jgi:hypothetical protein
VDEFLPDRRGIGVVARRLRAQYAEIDRDQERAQAITGLDVMRPGQADQAADFAGDIRADVRLSQLRAELLVVRPGRVVDDIVPPDGLVENFAIGIGKAVDARERGETVFDMREVVIVAARRGVGGNQFVAAHRQAPSPTAS